MVPDSFSNFLQFWSWDSRTVNWMEVLLKLPFFSVYQFLFYTLVSSSCDSRSTSRHSLAEIIASTFCILHRRKSSIFFLRFSSHRLLQISSWDFYSSECHSFSKQLEYWRPNCTRRAFFFLSKSSSLPIKPKMSFRSSTSRYLFLSVQPPLCRPAMGGKKLCKSSSTHTWHLALQPYFSHPRYLVIPSPTHKHELGTVKGQNLLITIHLDQSIYLTNQELVFNCALAFASLSILSKNAEP